MRLIDGTTITPGSSDFSMSFIGSNKDDLVLQVIKDIDISSCKSFNVRNGKVELQGVSIDAYNSNINFCNSTFIDNSKQSHLLFNNVDKIDSCTFDKVGLIASSGIKVINITNTIIN